jgi:hypothetical protein
MHQKGRHSCYVGSGSVCETHTVSAETGWGSISFPVNITGIPSGTKRPQREAKSRSGDQPKFRGEPEKPIHISWDLKNPHTAGDFSPVAQESRLGLATLLVGRLYQLRLNRKRQLSTCAGCWKIRVRHVAKHVKGQACKVVRGCGVALIRRVSLVQCTAAFAQFTEASIQIRCAETWI